MIRGFKGGWLLVSLSFNMVADRGDYGSESQKIVFSSHISLKCAFINRFKHFFKRLFPLGHRKYLFGVISPE